MLSTLNQEDLMDLSKRHNALYLCPHVDAVRKGPLVVYAGKYAGPDGQSLNYVGEDYFNFRRLERHLSVVSAFAQVAFTKLVASGLLDTFDTICGIPNGGRTFGQELARISGKEFVYPEKEPIPTESGMKQEFAWNLNQFEFRPGERVAIVEDVVNNCQNTDSTLALVNGTGAQAVLMICAFNRSPKYQKVYTPIHTDGMAGDVIDSEIPIIASINKVINEYRQDDPFVLEDMLAGNIEFEVKKNWSRLRAAMDQHATV